MSHEKSITIEADGKFYNIPTVIRGEEVSTDEAVKRFRKGRLKPLGGKSFSSEKEAVEAAKERSKSFDKEDTEKFLFGPGGS